MHEARVIKQARDIVATDNDNDNVRYKQELSVNSIQQEAEV